MIVVVKWVNHIKGILSRLSIGQGNISTGGRMMVILDEMRSFRITGIATLETFR